MRGERGATTIEYVGVIVVVAAIVAAVAVAPLRTRLGSGLSTAICQIMGQTGCSTSSVATGPTSDTPGTGTPGTGTPGSGTPGSGTAGAGGDGAPGGPTIDQGPPLQIPVTDGPESCDGFLDCAGSALSSAGSALASAGEGAWTGLRDEARGTWDLITNPSQIADAGKAIWDNPWDSARQLVWDDESAQMADDGNTAGAVGRTGWNVGSWFVPGIDLLKVSKITKLSKIAKLAEAAEKIAGLTKKAETAATKAEKAAAAGDKAAADAAATEARKAADDAKKQTEGLNCPLALPPPGRLGGGGHGPILATAPHTTRLAGKPDPCKAAADADAAADRAEAARSAAVRTRSLKTDLQAWTNQRFQFGSAQFIISKSDMEHVLARHHPKYWDGSIKQVQTYFDPGMSITDVSDAMGAVAKQNRDTLATLGAGTGQVRGVVNGREYVLGVKNGHLSQFYPVPS